MPRPSVSVCPACRPRRAQERHPRLDTDAFMAEVRAEKRIVECHAMNGANDHPMEVVTRSIEHFSDPCMERILKFPDVLHVESAFSLKEIKQALVLPT